MTVDDYAAIKRALARRHPLVWAALPGSDAADLRAAAEETGRRARIWSVGGAPFGEPVDGSGPLTAAGRLLNGHSVVLLVRDLPADLGDEALVASLRALAAPKSDTHVVILAGERPLPEELRDAAVTLADLHALPESAAPAPPEPAPTAAGSRDPQPDSPGVASPAPSPPTWRTTTGWLFGTAFLLPVLLLEWLGGFGIENWLARTRAAMTLVYLGARVDSLIQGGDWWRWVTSALLSASLLHFLLNVAGIVLAASLLEPRLGRLRTILGVAATAVGGGLVASALGSEVGTGASAAVAGAIGMVVGEAARRRAGRELLALAPERCSGLVAVAAGLALLAFFDPWVDGIGALAGGATGILLGALAAPPATLAPRPSPALVAALATTLAVLALAGAGVAANARRQMPVLHGVLAQRNQAYATAISQYLLAEQRQPHFVELERELARVLHLGGDFGSARVRYDRYLRARPHDLDARFALGQLLYYRGEYREAVTHFERVIRSRPRHLAAIHLLADSLVRDDRHREARERIHALLLTEDADTEQIAFTGQLLRDCGVLTMTRGYPRDAEPFLRDALEIASDRTFRARVENDLAWLLAEYLKERYDEAERLVSGALEVDPENPIFLATLAWVYYRCGRFDQALGIQQQAVRIVLRSRGRFGPGVEEFYYRLGRIQEAAQHPELARISYAMALAARTDFAPARAALERLGGIPAALHGPPVPETPPPVARPAASSPIFPRVTEARPNWGVVR